MNYFLPLLVFAILFAACDNRQSQSGTEKEKKDTVITELHENLESESAADSTLEDLTKTILKHLKKKNYYDLAQYIHPTKGVRLSPYGYINRREDMIILADYLIEISKDPMKRIWGTYDGTGDTIRLSFKEYFDKFVYDVDFLNAEKLSTNRSLAQGNSLNNISEIYPGTQYTESYFSGFNKKYQGMDWRALRLVFEKQSDKYYLVGIIHDQWTI